ncbi:DUF2513 domain-containing protein [Pontibacter locisalis]|uniref:DUF2513 domain-containing protein n=1 Tax=Pontibacter locisalis TaxID=1719035 RepID=A0ABW5IMP5_9BACT
MRRDIDLIRKILLEVEMQDTLSENLSLEIEGASKKEISYHVKLLAQAGYLEANNNSTRDSPDEWNPICLTWQGHEFLDAARDNTIWNKTKVRIGEKLPSITFDVLKSMLIVTLKQQFGLEI